MHGRQRPLSMESAVFRGLPRSLHRKPILAMTARYSVPVTAVWEEVSESRRSYEMGCAARIIKCRWRMSDRYSRFQSALQV